MKQEQRKPYQRYLTKLTLLAALPIFLASLEIFFAVGNPQAFLKPLGLQTYAVEEVKLLLLFHFLRQIYVPVLLATSSYILLPKIGLQPVYRYLWGLLLAVQLIFTLMNPLSTVVFKALRASTLLLLMLWILNGSLKGRTEREETDEITGISQG